MKEQPAVDFFAAHRGQPAILLGNGPSLNWVKDKALDLSPFVKIGMNRSWEIVPDFDYHCIMFHYEHLTDLQKRKFSMQNKVLWTYKDYTEMWVRDINEGSVIYVPAVCDPKSPLHEYNIAGLISTDLSDCSYADMTGHFALEVALWMRCDPIYLLGFDFYGGHFCDKLKPEEDWREMQIELFELAAAQIRAEVPWANIYNLNPESRVRGFDFIDFEEIMKWKKENIN